MVTFRVNIVALILAGLAAWLVAIVLIQMAGFTWREVATVAFPVLVVIRIYDAVAGLPAFKGGNKGKKDGGK